MPSSGNPPEPLSIEAAFDSRVHLAQADILVLSPTPTAPTDQGNRKRIHSVCSELKRRGARIHFVYYPQEWWFSYAPMDRAREMAAQWDNFYLLPATRPLHSQAEQDDHTIDEWWDKAIGKYLKWLFKNAHYDAFIVNYAYLSKAFKYAPEGTLKILDTHDKMTGRRQLLEDNGIAREFFYTTVDQETIALDRAHLIWAIKEEEARFFRSISKTPCITMPHVESRRVVAREHAAADEDYLVVGMLGARNSINISNARAFVSEALPLFRQNLAPIKIRFAGSMCLDNEVLRLAATGVDILGPVNTVEEFYAAVDLVVVPMAFSTGLKIKAVEAFATGMPLVAMSHALEGIPVEHPFHRCRSNEAIAEACVELAYNPGLLQQLRQATLETYSRLEQQAAAAFDATAALMNRDPLIVVLLDQRFFEPESPYREHARQTLRELSEEGRVVLYFDQELPPVQGTLLTLMSGMVQLGKICLAPEIAGEQHHSLGMMSFVSSLDALLLSCRRSTLWVLRVPPALGTLSDEAAARTSMIVRADALRLYQPGALTTLVDSASRFESIRLIDGSAAGTAAELLPWLEQGQQLLNLPFWKYAYNGLKKRSRQSTRIDIVMTSDQLTLALILADGFNEISRQGPACRLVMSDGNWPATIGEHPTAVVRDLMQSFDELAALPRFVVDLCGDVGNAASYLETLRQLDVAIYAGHCHWLTDGRLMPTSLLDWIDAMLSFDPAGQPEEALRSKASRYSNEPGWRGVRQAIAATRL